MKHPLFAGEAFSRAMAWQWMIEKACWAPTTLNVKGRTIDLQRGQFCASRDDLAKEFQWSPSAVERFLARLQHEQMIERQTGQGKSVITICNYSKHQANFDAAGQEIGQEIGQTAYPDRDRTGTGQEIGQAQPDTTDGNKTDFPAAAGSPGQADFRGDRENRTANKEERNKEKKERGGETAPRARSEYAFAGSVIRLNDAHFGEWKARYHGIPDFRAELASLDAWFAIQPEEKRRSWFHTAQGALNRKHQEAVKSGGAAGGSSQELRNVFEMADAAERRRQRWEQQQREKMG
ncbi:hypothetical protein [Sphingobium sp. CAP-1]|uniref:hypothetical protein n=1 Tax=Sphingobium sp. CAP-1 TaxID=2676077 RepID=UPI0012BB3CD9|nr:hypothetical protein [Sphingobium sp. CAP-1]QGP80016.1 hypothetical protein GL174_14245 [Sphingobium sp. CAP-1]